MDSSPLNRLPHDTLHQIFIHLPLGDIFNFRCVCKAFNESLSSPAFLRLFAAHQPPLSLLALRHSHDGGGSPSPSLLVYDTSLNHWFRLPLSFLPFRSHHPITSSHGLLYLWAENPTQKKTLVACNPLIRDYKVLPQPNSAWFRRGSVLVGSPNQVIVLTELSTVYFSSPNNNWQTIYTDLPSKPRSPILISDTILALCNVGSPSFQSLSQWKLFKSTIKDLQVTKQWTRLEKHEWGDIFDVLK